MSFQTFKVDSAFIDMFRIQIYEDHKTSFDKNNWFISESDWNDLGYGVQKSESFITIRLAVDCYDDTHYTSGTYDKVRERQLKAKELYKALQEFQCTEETSPLVRVKSRDYSLPGNIKVYETVYSFTLHDESAMQ